MSKAWLAAYRKYRSYGHGWFVSATMATPFWVFIVVPMLIGVVAHYVF